MARRAQARDSGSRNGTRASRRYLVALCVVGLAGAASHVSARWAAQTQIETVRATADLVELGRVSQDVIRIAQSRHHAPSDEALEHRLETTVHVVGKLRGEFRGSELAPIRALARSRALDTIESEGRALLQSVPPNTGDNARVAALREQRHVLAGQIDAASTALTVESEQDDRRASWLSWGLLGLLLGAGAFEGFCVVLPALRQSRRDAEDLAEAELAVLDAADQERVRLGQEMHDGLCQNLGGLRLLADAAKTGGASPSAERTLNLISDLAERSLRMTRTFSHGLYPGDVRSDNLAAALERLGDEMADTGAFAFAFCGTDTDALECADEDAMHLYRIAQEALSNAVRHGQPSHVEIQLECTTEGASLRIQDDGVGMSTTVDVLAGVGLSSMRARARAMGASIDISSSPGDGTRVDVTLA